MSKRSGGSRGARSEPKANEVHQVVFGSASKRIFFGAVISDDAANEARALAEDLDAQDNAVRWVPPANYHVTLRFIGTTDSEQIPQIIAAVSKESSPLEAFPATLGPLLLLPNPRRTQAIALEIESEGRLEALAECVERGVREAGVTPSERPFRPHLTLGRTRRGRNLPAALRFPHTPVPVSFLVDAAWLFESSLSKEGAHYHALERVSLGAATHPH